MLGIRLLFQALLFYTVTSTKITFMQANPSSGSISLSIQQDGVKHIVYTAVPLNSLSTFTDSTISDNVPFSLVVTSTLLNVTTSSEHHKFVGTPSTWGYFAWFYESRSQPSLPVVNLLKYVDRAVNNYVSQKVSLLAFANMDLHKTYYFYLVDGDAWFMLSYVGIETAHSSDAVTFFGITPTVRHVTRGMTLLHMCGGSYRHADDIRSHSLATATFQMPEETSGINYIIASQGTIISKFLTNVKKTNSTTNTPAAPTPSVNVIPSTTTLEYTQTVQFEVTMKGLPSGLTFGKMPQCGLEQGKDLLNVYLSTVAANTLVHVQQLCVSKVTQSSHRRMTSTVLTTHARVPDTLTASIVKRSIEENIKEDANGFKVELNTALSQLGSIVGGFTITSIECTLPVVDSTQKQQKQQEGDSERYNRKMGILIIIIIVLASIICCGAVTFCVHKQCIKSAPVQQDLPVAVVIPLSATTQAFPGFVAPGEAIEGTVLAIHSIEASEENVKDD